MPLQAALSIHLLLVLFGIFGVVSSGSAAGGCVSVVKSISGWFFVGGLVCRCGGVRLCRGRIWLRC